MNKDFGLALPYVKFDKIVHLAENHVLPTFPNSVDNFQNYL